MISTLWPTVLCLEMLHKRVLDLPPCSYLKRLAGVNGLGDVSFVVPAAMRFGTRLSWWGSRKARPLPHEGVDLCRYLTPAGDQRALCSGDSVPVAFAGEVWAISTDDFIGCSIFVRHEGCCGPFFTVYAHVTPRIRLAPGDSLAAGARLAALADPGRRNLTISPHLHLSLVKFSDALPKEALRWSAMGSGTDVCFYDPAPLLGDALVPCRGMLQP